MAPLQADKKQVAVALERQAGVPNSALLDSPLSQRLATSNVTINLTPELEASTATREGLTQLKKTVGKESVSIVVEFPLRGTNDGKGNPAWKEILEAGGFRSAEVDKITGTVANGPFRHDEKITQAGTNAEAYIFKDAYNGDPQVYVRDVTGAVDGTGVWTGESTAATLTPSAINVPDGLGFAPVSKSTKAILIATENTAFIEGQLFQGVSSGARGIFRKSTEVATFAAYEIEKVRGVFQSGEDITAINQAGVYDAALGNTTLFAAANAGEVALNFPTVSQRVNEDGVAVTIVSARSNFSMEFEAGKEVKCTVTTQGVVNAVGDLVFVPGVVKDNRNAPKWGGVAMAIRDGEGPGEFGDLSAQAPCLSTFNFDMGVQLADRLCATAENGVEETFASDRTPTGGMDPEATREADIPWLGWLRSGNLVAFRTALGETDGNRFSFDFPGLQFTTAASGDRSNILTRDINFDLTGGNLYNATEGGEVGTQGNDNEVVFIYHRDNS